MTIAELSDEEASHLLAMPKYPVDLQKTWNFPEQGEKITIALHSADESERFVLSAEKSKYKIEKVNYHTRARLNIMIARLDLDPDGRHVNPDGNRIVGPHLHEYRSGFGDRWAKALPQECFPDATDRQGCWERFLKYCNVLKMPDVRFNLFS